MKAKIQKKIVKHLKRLHVWRNPDSDDAQYMYTHCQPNKILSIASKKNWLDDSL